MYADDIVLVGNFLGVISSIKDTLHKHFGIKDLGTLKFFLGLEATHSSRGISLCKHQYCLDLLSDAGVLGCKPASTTLDPHIRLSQDDGVPYSDVAGHGKLIGRLLYLTTTQLDISHAVQQLSQFLAKPTVTHHQAAPHVLKYLKGKRLFFTRSSSTQLLGFTDADWGGCPDSRWYVSGFCFYLWDSLIS